MNTLVSNESAEERSHIIAPVWFDESPFREDTFENEQYVTELSRYVPLDTIAGQLNAFLGQLKNDLVEVINEKYNDYVGLAGQMTGAEGAIIRMAKPLTDLRVALVKKKMEIVERGIESELELLKATLDRRQKLRVARRSLEAMQSAVQISCKVEKLMQELDDVMRQTDITQQSSLLERATREIAKLTLLQKENQELELIRGIVEHNLQRVAQMIAHLKLSLRTVLTSELPDHASLLRLLNAFSVVEESGAAEDIIREALLLPLLRSIAAELTNTVDLRQLIERYLEGMDRLYGGVFVVVRDASAGLRQYDFLGSCILAAFHKHLMKTHPTAFSPGKPDMFLKNFKASAYLIDRLEASCGTVTALEQFRNGPALSTFMKAWNLQVYFAMRFQEIAGVLDQAIDAETFSMRTNEDGFSFGVVSVWVQCLKQCFNQQIVTSHLSDQFMKLFFKLLSRFEHWLSGSVHQLEQQQSSEGSQGETNLPGKSVELVLLDSDVRRGVSVLASGFYLEAVVDTYHEVVQLAVEHCIERLKRCQSRLLGIVGERLLSECTAIVKKSVGTAASTMFRPSGERPTTPNDYVKRLMDPLRFFLDASVVMESVTTDVREQIKVHVSKGLCLAYRQALMDNLSFWEKSRMSLMRINKGRMAMSTNNAASDTSKGDELANVYHQHWLDISAFGQILKEFEMTDLEEYRDLLDVIISKKESHVTPSL